MERGIKYKPIYSSKDKSATVQFYEDFISKIEHWHLVAFTRSKTILNDIQRKLEKLNIRTIQNDIPHYKASDDRI